MDLGCGYSRNERVRNRRSGAKMQGAFGGCCVGRKEGKYSFYLSTQCLMRLPNLYHPSLDFDFVLDLHA